MPAATGADAATKADKDNFEECLASQPFVFIIGKENKEFHVHKEFVGKLSPALNALVNGRMREAREGKVEWPDLAVDTFIRFAKYAYSRDYTEAASEILAVAEEPEAIDLTSEDDDVCSRVEAETFAPARQCVAAWNRSWSTRAEGSEGLSSDPTGGLSESDVILFERRPRQRSPRMGIHEPYSFKAYMEAWSNDVKMFRDDHEIEQRGVFGGSRRSKRQRLDNGRRALRECSFTPPEDRNYIAMRYFCDFCPPHPSLSSSSLPSSNAKKWEPERNTKPYESYEPVFLSHANLYVLAEKYDVDGLKALVLNRLHATLLNFTMFPDRIPDLVSLVHTIYDNTIEKDPARVLVSRYFGCMIEVLRACEEVKILLRQEGEFADDVIEEMVKRFP